jgi:hypothetical protein
MRTGLDLSAEVALRTSWKGSQPANAVRCATRDWSTNGPLLIGPKMFAQYPFENLAGAALR